MHIEKIKTDKKRFLDLLLLADEQEDMIDKYLSRGDMFALYHHGELRSICVVTKESPDLFEIKNIATRPAYQRMGYGKHLLAYIVAFYRDKARVIQVGTGDSPETLGFYQRGGFVYSHTVKHFFIDNYRAPIFDNGKQLVDMIYLKKSMAL